MSVGFLRRHCVEGPHGGLVPQVEAGFHRSPAIIRASVSPSGECQNENLLVCGGGISTVLEASVQPSPTRDDLEMPFAHQAFKTHLRRCVGRGKGAPEESSPVRRFIPNSSPRYSVNVSNLPLIRGEITQ